LLSETRIEETTVLLDTQKKAEIKDVRKTVGENVGFERTRRITGYLVGTLDRFNNAKRAEERDRVKHGLQHPSQRHC
jgi:anaerobic ribonucleoside-triphosphate reductase